MTTPEQRELEHLRRLVAAYRELHREAWRPVEKPWSEVRRGRVVLDGADVPWIVRRDGDGAQVSNGGKFRTVDPDPAATVRVLAPMPSDMTDLLLASELGAACARVDGEA